MYISVWCLQRIPAKSARLANSYQSRTTLPHFLFYHPLSALSEPIWGEVIGSFVNKLRNVFLEKSFAVPS